MGLYFVARLGLTWFEIRRSVFSHASALTVAVLMAQTRVAYAVAMQNLAHTSTKKNWESKLTDSWFAL